MMQAARMFSKNTLQLFTSHGEGRRFNPYHSNHLKLLQITRIIKKKAIKTGLLFITKTPLKLPKITEFYQKRCERGVNGTFRIDQISSKERVQLGANTGAYWKDWLDKHREYGGHQGWRGLLRDG